ncbi:MAG: class I SAM-dependent methyltransferase [Actinobacteria bacterium]|nr:class I SAM-dependent methyltransferase [Actinomycetota bacterium]
MLTLVESVCSICGRGDRGRFVASGVDFEYHTTQDTFHVYRCCDTLFLNPRPSKEDLAKIYPEEYHAYEFSAEEYGIAFKARRWLEGRRLMRWCRGMPTGASIVDVGAGDGFHLEILRKVGDPTWRLVGIEPAVRAASVVASRGIEVHNAFLEEAGLADESFDLALMIMVIEHVPDPVAMLDEVRRILRPGGRIGLITDNIGSMDARFGSTRHWGGYHFPRHLNLYSRDSLRNLATAAGLEVVELKTMVSPVNWTYTVHNRLVDRGAPEWATGLFTLRSAPALSFFTALDALAAMTGNGALLRAVLRRPR